MLNNYSENRNPLYKLDAICILIMKTFSLSNILTFNFFFKLGTSTIKKTELNIITILVL